MSLTFNWEKYELAGIGHSPQLMANDALQYLLSSFLSNDDFNDAKAIFPYPNPVENELFFDNSKIKAKSATLYSISRKKVVSLNFKDFSSNQNIDVSKLAIGVYFLKIRTTTIKIMKE